MIRQNGRTLTSAIACACLKSSLSFSVGVPRVVSASVSVNLCPNVFQKVSSELSALESFLGRPFFLGGVVFFTSDFPRFRGILMDNVGAFDSASATGLDGRSSEGLRVLLVVSGSFWDCAFVRWRVIIMLGGGAFFAASRLERVTGGGDAMSFRLLLRVTRPDS